MANGLWCRHCPPQSGMSGQQRPDLMLDIEIWNQAADSAISLAHAPKARETIARELANRLQILAPTVSRGNQWGFWTWAEIPALDAQMFSICIAQYLLPHDLRNELAGQHLLILQSARISEDSDDRILWVDSYYHVQRVRPVSLSGPHTSEWTTYVRTLLERISHQMTFDMPERNPCRPAQNLGRSDQQQRDPISARRPTDRRVPRCAGLVN